MKKTIERVKEILTKCPSMRDSDRYLVCRIWDLEFEASNYYKTFPHDFITFYEKGYATSESTIRRARRKVQEIYPELRGKKWHERHAQQEQVKKELGYE